jgi:hypothetical protein
MARRYKAFIELDHRYCGVIRGGMLAFPFVVITGWHIISALIK